MIEAMSGFCIKPRGALTISQARRVDALKQKSKAFAVLRSLAMRFRGIFRSRDSTKLEEWIDDAVPDSPPWPVLPAFFAVISTPSATPSTCPGAMVRLKVRSTA
jgi:hypothetical protein